MELEIELIKAQFYVAEAIICAEEAEKEFDESKVKRNAFGMFTKNAGAAIDKAVKDTGAAVGKAAESVSKTASDAAGKAGEAVDKAKKEAGAAVGNAEKAVAKTVEQAKKEVQTFVQDIFSKEHLETMNKFKDTPENRKAVQKVFNDLGKKLSSDTKEAVNSAIKEVKKFDVQSIADKAVEKSKKALGSPEAKEIGCAAAMVGFGILGGVGILTMLAGVGTLAGGLAVGSAAGAAAGVAGIVGGIVLQSVTHEAARLTANVFDKSIKNQRQKEAHDKLKEVLPESKPKAPEPEKSSESEAPKKRKRDPEFEKLVLQFSDTDPDDSFKQKYKEKNGKEYDKKSDPVVNKLNDDILDISAEIAEIVEDSFDLNPESPEGKSAQDKIKQMNDKSKELLKKRADYYKSQDGE